MPTDVLAGGSDAPRRPWTGALAVVLALLVVAGVAVERWESRRQLDALLTAAAEAEQVVHDARRSLGGLVRYSNGLLARTDLGPEQRASVLDTFAVDARRFPPRTDPARQALREVRPLPWDGELRAARDAYLVRLDAWADFVAEAQDEPDSLLRERRATREVREAAAAAVERAADGRAAAQVSALTESLLRR